MTPSPAPACKQALAEATRRWPKRSRAGDGIMGDAAHQARKSDHNDGNAFDLTHDPAHGPNCHVLSVEVLDDQRVSYVIWNGRIWKARTRLWEIYDGSNPHTKHMHVSIKAESRNDLSAWPWSSASAWPVLAKGSEGQPVRVLQAKLDLHIDGKFGPATETAVRRFQKKKRLPADGVVGPKTWAALG